jgi:hypothetical protein
VSVTEPPDLEQLGVVFSKKNSVPNAYVDVNAAMLEVIELMRSNSTATSDPHLIMNAIEAMTPMSEGVRELLISTSKGDPHRAALDGAIDDRAGGLQ